MIGCDEDLGFHYPVLLFSTLNFLPVVYGTALDLSITFQAVGREEGNKRGIFFLLTKNSKVVFITLTLIPLSKTKIYGHTYLQVGVGGRKKCLYLVAT